MNSDHQHGDRGAGVIMGGEDEGGYVLVHVVGDRERGSCGGTRGVREKCLCSWSETSEDGLMMSRWMESDSEGAQGDGENPKGHMDSERK